MALRDSDSSEDEVGEYTSTNVLLGYAEETPKDDSFSRLGGFPVRHMRNNSLLIAEQLTRTDLAR